MAAKQSSQKDEMLFVYFNELNIIAQLSSNLFARVLPEGLTSSQFAVLNWFIRVDRQATPGRLAAAFQVTRGAMTNTLGKLSDKGFVSISVDPENARSKIVRLTPSGKKMRDKAIKSTAPLLTQLAMDTDVDRLAAQLPDLRRLRAYLDEHRLVGS